MTVSEAREAFTEAKIRLGRIQESKYPAIFWILGYLLFYCILIVLITCCRRVEKLLVNRRAETYEQHVNSLPENSKC